MEEQNIQPINSVGSFLSNRLKISGFSFDQNNALIETDSNASHYFDREINDSVEAIDLFPFLIGIDLSKEKEFPYIELPNGSIVDAFITPTADGYDVILIDMSIQREKHQQVQQIANVVSLQKDVLADENVELDAANQAKSKFISTFSHELKTPLSSILGYSDLLRNGEQSGKSMATSANAIHRNGIYLLNLINNVLEQGRADIQQTEIVTSHVILSELMDNITYLVQPLVDRKNLDFSIHFGCAKDLVLVLDEQHLSQVLVNIITNAIKYSEKGYINTEVSFADGELVFTVSDTGIGIPEDELSNIMRPFGRAKHTAHIEGAGIGLSLSNTLATLMGGDLKIQSEFGVGTTVTVTVPTTEAAQITKSTQPEAPQKHQVLLAEDDEDLVPLIGYYLEEGGYDVLTATSKAELNETLKNHQPSLILMDHNLREANGIELTKELLQSGYAGKIVMLTASTGEAIIKQAMNAGCVDFISKPIDREKLIQNLATHLNV